MSKLSAVPRSYEMQDRPCVIAFRYFYIASLFIIHSLVGVCQFYVNIKSNDYFVINQMNIFSIYIF